MQAEVVGVATLDLGGCARSSVFRPMLAHLPGCNFLLISLPRYRFARPGANGYNASGIGVCGDDRDNSLAWG